MSHYRLNDVEPSAIVTVNGSEKKIYDNNQIFLNPNDNFEFRFFNPLQEKLGIEIIFNGQKKDKSLLILKPGEDVSIDRFMNDKKKMKYSTYFIDGNNEQAVKATEKNGLVEFNFYKEKLWNNYNYDWSSYNSTFTSGSTYNSTFTSGSSTSTGLPHYGNTTTLRNVNGMGNVSVGDISPTNTLGVYGSIGDSGTFTTNFSDTFNGAFTTTNISNSNSRGYTKSLETGRVEKGETSNQDFKEIDLDFETTPFHSINYELKPQSTYISDIAETRNYCGQCSYRIRKKHWRYCPKCGDKL